MGNRHLLVMSAGGAGHTVPESPISQEYDLQEAFKEHPELIPVSDLGLSSLLVIGRETTVGSGGSVDLLAVDAKGRVVVAEFKRGPQNPDSRMVIAQVLEYASWLWGMSYEDLDEVATTRYFQTDRCADSRVKNARSLDDAAVACWGEQEGFSVEDFRQGVTAALADGELNLVIVSSEVGANTARVIDYLNTTARFRCFGIEVDHFSDAERRVFVPRASVIPASGTRDVSRSPVGPKTTLVNFLGSLSEGGRAFFGKLLDYMQSTGETVYWGQRGFSFRISVAGAPRTVFYGWPPNTMGHDREWAQLVVLYLRQAGVPEDVLGEYSAASAGLTVTKVGPTGSIDFSVDGKADERQAQVLILAFDRLLASARSEGSSPGAPA